MKVSAMTLMWIGSILIAISIAMQMAALFLPSLSFALTMIGLALNAASVIFTIRQAYRSALEQQQKDLFIYSRTPEGRQLSNLYQQRTSMTKDSHQ